jgi:hypothetical protein
MNNTFRIKVTDVIAPRNALWEQLTWRIGLMQLVALEYDYKVIKFFLSPELYIQNTTTLTV